MKDPNPTPKTRQQRIKPEKGSISKRIRKQIGKAKRPLLTVLKIQGGDEKKDNVFTPFMFSKIKTLCPIIKKSLGKNGFIKLTHIQAKSYNPIYKGNNCVVKSETGSGKTLAYLIPLLNDLLQKEPNIRRSDGIRFLILCPVRELCLQIYELFERLNQCFKRVVAGILVGGEETKREKARIRKGLNLLICTPGRLIYHINSTQALNLSKVKCLIIEEADQLLDMGMRSDSQSIINSIVKASHDHYLQYLLVSASITHQVEDLLLFIKVAEEQAIRPNAEIEADQMGPGQMPSNQVGLINVVDIQEQRKTRQLKFKRVGFEATKTQVGKGKGKEKEKGGSGITSQHKLKIKTPNTMSHMYVGVKEKWKLGALLLILRNLDGFKVMVFVATADEANFLEEIMTKLKCKGNDRQQPQPEHNNHRNQGQDQDQTDPDTHKQPQHTSKPQDSKAIKEETSDPEFHPFFNSPVFKIHGHMEQKARAKVFNAFMKCKTGFLLSTDVGARGMDYVNTQFVVHFDLPSNVKGYINRSGRTARINSRGSAISLVYEPELPFFKECQRLHSIKHEPLELDELARFINNDPELEANGFFENLFISFKDKEKAENGEVIEPAPGFAVSNFTRSICETLVYKAKQVLRNSDTGQWLARRAFNSFCRSYNQTQMKWIFQLKKLHLHHLSKGFCLDTSKGQGSKTSDRNYRHIKDSKPLSDKQLRSVYKKRYFTKQGLKNTSSKKFLANEFMQ